MRSSAPAPAQIRTLETARPAASGRRMRTAPVIPPPPPLSVVERIPAEHFPCAGRCGRDGTVPTLVPAVGTTLAVLFCEACVEELAPRGARPLPVAKGAR